MAEEIEVINPFYDIDELKQRVDNQQMAIDSLRNLKEMSVGEGSKVMRLDSSGIWLGAEKFADAPFSVDMEGNVIASTLSLSQYLSKTDTSQTLTGSINVGDSTIVVDGVNGRQLFYNGGIPSIVIGNPA